MRALSSSRSPWVSDDLLAEGVVLAVGADLLSKVVSFCPDGGEGVGVVEGEGGEDFGMLFGVLPECLRGRGVLALTDG